jgi:hypothetical protein
MALGLVYFSEQGVVQGQTIPRACKESQ